MVRKMNGRNEFCLDVNADVGGHRGVLKDGCA